MEISTRIEKAHDNEAKRFGPNPQTPNKKNNRKSSAKNLMNLDGRMYGIL